MIVSYRSLYKPKLRPSKSNGGLHLNRFEPELSQPIPFRNMNVPRLIAIRRKEREPIPVDSKNSWHSLKTAATSKRLLPERKLERTALPGFARHVDLAVVGLGDMFDDGKAKSRPPRRGARAAFIDAVKTLE